MNDLLVRFGSVLDTAVVEIPVYEQRMEGGHLRVDSVARSRAILDTRRSQLQTQRHRNPAGRCLRPISRRIVTFHSIRFDSIVAVPCYVLWRIYLHCCRGIAERTLKELIDRHLAFNSNRLFKLLQVISVLNGDLIKQILPRIKQLVVITEAKRGTGIDSTLRLIFFFSFFFLFAQGNLWLVD